ncbi:hypothetical protein A6V39_04480 [Candidatus Mycoplasma haematobovis]|uniref:Uncharacterized protein n=1 Tax=Candidatus Mycoplasma haematobovis TaxID=432608 RepID=A0A1A9QDS1_9MOLU|nr:hypothetical protein [Candidatus Mycoplasma haematobovis]OAL10141.1 hypothetical protein A6V39_04480 [Candidatus Mycoplasma haematobovis]
MFNSKSSILISSSLLVSGSSILVYELKKPRSIKDAAEWRGIKLAKEEDEFVWGALLFQKKDALKEKKIEDKEALKKYCIDLYKKGIDDKLVSDVENFCSDTLNTRKARIIGKGFLEDKFLTADDDFKVAFTLNRYTPVFISLINSFSGKKYTDKTEAKDAWEDYKNYCDTKLNQNEDTELQLVQTVCEKKGIKTAQSKIEAEGRIFLNKDQLKNKFQELKRLNEMQGDTLLNDIQDKEKPNHWQELKEKEDVFTERLIKWCEEQKTRKLFEEGFYPDVYSRLRTRCTEENKTPVVK